MLFVVLSIVDYSTAGRMIKTGLTASVVVSNWTWAATILQSSNVAWEYGVSGPFWYVQSIGTMAGQSDPSMEKDMKAG